MDVHNQDHDVEGVNQPKINHFEVGRLLKKLFVCSLGSSLNTCNFWVRKKGQHVYKYIYIYI